MSAFGSGFPSGQWVAMQPSGAASPRSAGQGQLAMGPVSVNAAVAAASKTAAAPGKVRVVQPPRRMISVPATAFAGSGGTPGNTGGGGPSAAVAVSAPGQTVRRSGSTEVIIRASAHSPRHHHVSRQQPVRLSSGGDKQGPLQQQGSSLPAAGREQAAGHNTGAPLGSSVVVVASSPPAAPCRQMERPAEADDAPSLRHSYSRRSCSSSDPGGRNAASKRAHSPPMSSTPKGIPLADEERAELLRRIQALEEQVADRDEQLKLNGQTVKALEEQVADRHEQLKLALRENEWLRAQLHQGGAAMQLRAQATPRKSTGRAAAGSAVEGGAEKSTARVAACGVSEKHTTATAAECAAEKVAPRVAGAGGSEKVAATVASAGVAEKAEIVTLASAAREAAKFPSNATSAPSAPAPPMEPRRLVSSPPLPLTGRDHGRAVQVGDRLGPAQLEAQLQELELALGLRLGGQPARPAPSSES